MLLPLVLAVLAIGALFVARGPRQLDPDTGRATVSPVVAGLHGRHPLDERAVGEVLIGELGCASCHAGAGTASSPHKAAPDLSDVGSRVEPGFMRRFIADPGVVQPGTTMPQVLTGVGRKEREEIADAITQFLVARASTPFERGPVDEADVDAGRTLFHMVGCVACHAPREAPVEGGPPPASSDGATGLTHVPAKYGLGSLSRFLHQPMHARPSGRMPDMGLTQAEARAIASYLLGTAAVDAEPIRTEPSRVEAGRAYFAAFGCVACHQIDGVASPPANVAGGRLDPTRGCLSARPRGAPDYSLSEEQRRAIRAALADGGAAASADERVAITLTAFNCIGCHVRDGYGGVAEAIDPYFTTTEPSLGNDARLPPPLTMAGAKLRTEWLHRVLFDSAGVRPYVRTRMPRFGEANLGHLPALLESADPPIPHEMPALGDEAAREARDAGRELLGTDALGCVTCHNFNGKDSPAFKGLDLITTTERLRPGWYARFMLNPQGERPGIIMPAAWPGGVASRADILDGDTDAQVWAIWSFLSQGRTARDPVGIRTEPTVLTVSDTTRTYRGRSRIAGFRGIAVGFPEGLSYAFNANTGALAGLWRGGFVRVRWDGQGAGDFDPASRAIALAQDVGFCRLDTPEAPWPLRPHMDDDHPLNPDPLYPRRLGYRFGGYFLDEESVPTFMYRIGEVAIEDRSIAGVSGDDAALVRTVRLASPDADTLYLRVLTGDIVEVSPGLFEVGGLRVTVPPASALVRPSAAADVGKELLLRLDLPAGESTIEIRYDMLD